MGLNSFMFLAPIALRIEAMNVEFVPKPTLSLTVEFLKHV